MPASIVAGEARQLAHFLEISPGDLPEEETECEIPEGVQFVRGGFVRPESEEVDWADHGPVVYHVLRGDDR